MTTGYVYCFSNPSMPGLYKVGETEKTLEERKRGLYTTGVPEPFIIEFAKKVANPKQMETYLFEALADYRHNNNREFFRAPLHKIKTLFNLMTGEEWTENKIDAIDDSITVNTDVSELTTESSETPSAPSKDYYKKLLTIGQPIGYADTWGVWNGTAVVYNDKSYYMGGFIKSILKRTSFYVKVNDMPTSWPTYKKSCLK